ncbi:hypothetical protein [Variovorax paradoxus]|uniref:hypothetical protein n=2 Tax=Variovorax TaxID=34072 RepID=UPI003399668C
MPPLETTDLKKRVTNSTINGKFSHLDLSMNDLTHSQCASDLGEKVAALNAVVTRLSENAEWLREETKRLGTEPARIRPGTQLPLWLLLQMQHEEFPVRVPAPGAKAGGLRVI